jgi:hypothetical protein
MDTEVKKFVERSIKRGDSLDQIKSTLVSYGWEENVNEATGYYDEFKKKSAAGTGLRAAGVSPSRQTVTPSSSGFASQETKNIPLEDPLLTKKDGFAKSLMEQLNLAAKDKNNRNKYVPTINKLWNEYSSIDRGAPTPLSLFEDNGAISKNSLNLLNESSARNAERMKREAIAIAKDDTVLESGVRSLWAGLLGTANYLGDLVDPDSYDDVPDAKTDLEKEAEAQSARAQKASYGRKLLAGYTDKQIEDGFFKNFADGNVATAFGLFGRDVVEVLPQVAANAIPYVGLPALAASAGGQAWLKIKDDEKYNTLEKFLYAPLVGAAEYFTEKFFGMDRKMIQEGLSKAFGKTITSAADIPKKELGDMIFGTLPKAVRAPLEEGFEESLVSTFTQTLDKIMAEKPFDPVEIAESAMLGAGAGGSTYALVRGSSALLQTPLFSDVYKITNTASKIENILKSEDISDEERVILTDRLNGYKTQMRKLQDGASDYYKQFSQEDKQKTLELNQTISRGIRSYSTMKTAEAKAETVNRIKQSLAEKAQIEQKYDSTQKQQVPSPVVQGAEPGGVPVQGTGTEAPQAGGVLQVPSQQEEKVVEAAKQPNVGFRPTKAKLTSQTLPQVLSGLKSYVESIPEETLQKFETTRQSITNGFESVANVISSFAKEGLNVEVEAINTEDEWNKATMDPTTGKPEKLSRGLYYQRGQEGAPSKIVLFAPALLGNTVYHEGIHEIVPQAFGQEGVNKVAKALASGIKRDTGLNAKFGNFLSQYEEGDKSEELLAELGSMVAAGDIDIEITKSLATRFMEAVASVLGAVGIKMAPNSSQLSEALLSYSQKLGAGAKLDIQKMEESRTRVQGLIGELFSTLGIDLGAPMTPKEADAQRVKRQDLNLPKKALDAFGQLKKAFGETNAKIIRSKVKSAIEYPDQFIEYVNKNFAVKEQVGQIVDVISTDIEANFLLSIGKEKKAFKPEQLKSVEELAEKAGFVFYETETEQDVLSFKSDYRQGEVICTFKDVKGRLGEKYIFWMRKDGFETILPAKEITKEYLGSDTIGAKLWREYLATVGVDGSTLFYDGKRFHPADIEDFLTSLGPKGVQPSREDPYGTSSLSVQIDKQDKSVMIINRYNHTVSNPDYTYKGKLDDIIQGLDDAIYSIPKVGGREEALDDDSEENEEKGSKVVKDLDGRYFFAETRTSSHFISKYGYIEKAVGVFKPIDRSYQRVVGAYVLDSKYNDIRVLFYPGYEGQDRTREILFPYQKIELSKDSVTIKTDYGTLKLGDINDKGVPESIEGDITQIGNNFDEFLIGATRLKKLDLPNLEIVGDEFLGSLTSYFSENRIKTDFDAISFPSLKRVGDSFLNDAFDKNKSFEFNFPSLEQAGRRFMQNINIKINNVLSFPKLKSFGYNSFDEYIRAKRIKYSVDLFVPNLKPIDISYYRDLLNSQFKSIVNDELFDFLNEKKFALLKEKAFFEKVTEVLKENALDTISADRQVTEGVLRMIPSWFETTKNNNLSSDNLRSILMTKGGTTVFNSKGEYFDPTEINETIGLSTRNRVFFGKFEPNEFPSVEVAPSESEVSEQQAVRKQPKAQRIARLQIKSSLNSSISESDYKDIEAIFNDKLDDVNQSTSESFDIIDSLGKDIDTERIVIGKDDDREEALMMSNLRVPLDFILGKTIGLGMSDTLMTGERTVDVMDTKTGKAKKETVREEGGIGYPFKSLIDFLNGTKNIVYGWAAVGKGPASKMVNSAQKASKIKGRDLKDFYIANLKLTKKQIDRLDKYVPDDKEYGIVGIYKMGDDGLYSNEAYAREAFRMIETELSEEEKTTFFNGVKDRLKNNEWFGKEKYIQLIDSANSFNELEDILHGKASKLPLDTKASIVRDIILSSEKTESTEKDNPVGFMLKSNGISLESVAGNISEPIMDGVSKGQLMLLVAIDPSSDIIDDKNRERHKNYPFITEGLPIGILEETAQLHNLSPQMMDSFVKGATTYEQTAKTTEKKTYSRITIYQNNSDGLFYAEEGTGPNKEKIKDSKGNFVSAKTPELLIKKLEKQGINISDDFKKKRYTQKINGFTFGYLMQTAKASTIDIFSTPKLSAQQKLVKLLQKAFPGVVVEMNSKDFSLMNEGLVEKKLINKNGAVYGFVDNGRVYINPTYLNNNTPIHEFGHIWNIVAREMRPKLYEKGVNLVKNSKYEDFILSSTEYRKIIKELFGKDALITKDGKNIINDKSKSFQDIVDYVADESLAKAIGDRGELFVTEAQKRNWMQWLSELFNAIKKVFGFEQMTEEQFQNLTINQFTDAVIKELLGGRKISDLTSEQIESISGVSSNILLQAKAPKRQGISKTQGPLVPVVYNSLLQQSTRNADGTNTPPYTLQEWLTMMTPYLNAQTATAIYNGVARNKPPFTAPSIQDAYDSSKKRMEAGKNKALFTWNNLKKYFIDRQAELKKAILASGMKNAYNYLVNKAGSGARAAYFYYEKEKDIYKNLKKEQIEKLDQIIMLRRIIEIDSNFDERDEARPKHTNGFNKGYAEMELSRLQSELGDAAYNDLNDRATKYFDAFRSLLDSMYEEGLVSEELYEQLRDIDYQPRLFLDHVFEMDEPSMREMNLSAAQIKRIKEGSEGDIMFDSRFLLALYAKSAFSKIARNKANKEIAKATDAQGNESWVSKTDKPGFSEVTYFEDGVKKSFYLKDNLKSELDDISRVSGMPQNIQKLIGMVTGSFAVKLLATRANPLFVAKNIPRDYLHVLFFTKAYDNMSLPLAAMRLAGDFIKGVKSKLQDDQDFKDFVEFGGGMDFLSTEGMESMITNRTVTNKIIEKLGKAGELSEIGFRLAMYKKFKEDGMKALGPNATEDEVTRVKVQAVTQAREMIDFSQGGIATKNLEIVSPYINSAFQGFRVSTSYIQNNPKEFAIKLGYLSIGVMMLALYNAMLGDDDMEDIPEETKRKYFIIMTPFTFEEDGKTKRHYVKIAKTQQLAPFIAGLELTSDYFVAGVMGRKPRESKDAYEYAWKGATMYFPKDPSNIKKEISSSVPLFAAIAAYDMNYDTYRERAVSMDYNQVLPQDEDFTNKQVPYFYKALAQGIGASGGEAGPKRLQVATEKFVTTPYSSLLTMGAYTILDSFSRLFELKGPGGIPVKDQAAISNSVSKSLGLSASKVFTGATEPDWRSYTRKEEIERINMEEKSERRGIKIAAQNIGQKYFEASNAKDSKALTEARKEYQDELMKIKKESGVPDAKYFMDAFQQARKYGKATNPEYNDISYAASNEAKARIIMEYGGRTMSRKELVDYIIDYKRKTGKPINGSEILREYQKETGYGK